METVLVVGHNPTAAELTSLLCDGEGSHEAHDALAQGFVTSGLAVLRYAGDWADLDAGSCALPPLPCRPRLTAYGSGARRVRRGRGMRCRVQPADTVLCCWHDADA